MTPVPPRWQGRHRVPAIRLGLRLPARAALRSVPSRSSTRVAQLRFRCCPPSRSSAATFHSPAAFSRAVACSSRTTAADCADSGQGVLNLDGAGSAGKRLDILLHGLIDPLRDATALERLIRSMLSRIGAMLCLACTLIGGGLVSLSLSNLLSTPYLIPLPLRVCEYFLADDQGPKSSAPTAANSVPTRRTAWLILSCVLDSVHDATAGLRARRRARHRSCVRPT